MNDIKIDSHKLMYHPCEVAKWMQGEEVYPIEVEISPSGSCNHRCTFCALDYVGYTPTFLDKDMILERLGELQKKGLKSVICSGEGEPLLNKDIREIINGIKSMGVDVALSTNGALLSREFSEQCLKSLSWIRFSIAAISPEKYSQIHQTKPEDIDKVLKNLEAAVQIKKEQNLTTTLGAQMILLEDNADEMLPLATKMKEIGIDYFTVKPFSQHLYSHHIMEVDYTKLIDTEKQLKAMEDENFRIYFRKQSMEQKNKKKNYDKCYGLPFMSHIDSRGNVWPCCAFIGQEGFSYGNIYEQTFEELWRGERRKAVIKKLDSLNIYKECRELCRLDKINTYLYELKHPDGHVNFI